MTSISNMKPNSLPSAPAGHRLWSLKLEALLLADIEEEAEPLSEDDVDSNPGVSFMRTSCIPCNLEVTGLISGATEVKYPR